jgi:HSP20 family protein
VKSEEVKAMSEIIRWDPFSRSLSLRDTLDRFFEGGLLRPWLARDWDAIGSLAIDLYETDEAFVVKAAAPGIKPEDIEIQVTNNVLTVRGETKEEEKEEGARYHRVERRYGRFERSVALPTRVNADEVEATLEDGILTIEVPKAEEVKPKKITVKVH